MCLPVEIINMPYRGAIILFAMPSPIEVKLPQESSLTASEIDIALSRSYSFPAK